jgi:hypothetical protein
MNVAETSINLHQLLKGKPLYSALDGFYVEVLNNIMAVLQANAAKDEGTTNAVWKLKQMRNSAST